MPTGSKTDNSLAAQLEARGSRPVAFDYLRLILAFSVILVHEPYIVNGEASSDLFWHSPWFPLFRLVVPMFFALSGFLIAASFERCPTMFSFFGLRALRIYPALAVETVLSSLVLGPILTGYALSRYFSDPLFVRYFRNILGDPQYLLPGLFAGNPAPGTVNQQLWTIPFELFCYISIGAVAVIGGRKHRIVAPIAAIVATLVYLAARYVHWGSLPDVHRSLAGPLLIPCFLAAVTLYFYRADIPARPSFMVAAIALSMVLLGMPGIAQFLAPWPLAYATVCIGTLKLPANWFSRSADYSYGMYLYGWPVQQTVVCLWPSLNGIAFNTVVSLVAAVAIAALSWHYVEKPTLVLRSKLFAIEQSLLARRLLPRRE